MRQEVRAPPPHGKKLFEWDAEKRLLIMVKRQKEYSYELAEDNTFVCVVEREKPCPGAKTIKTE